MGSHSGKYGILTANATTKLLTPELMMFNSTIDGICQFTFRILHYSSDFLCGQ